MRLYTSLYMNKFSQKKSNTVNMMDNLKNGADILQTNVVNMMRPCVETIKVSPGDTGLENSDGSPVVASYASL